MARIARFVFALTASLALLPASASADPFELNDTFGNAYDLGTGEASISAVSETGFDVDVFKWTATSDGEVRIDLLFSDGVSDLDLWLYDDPSVSVLPFDDGGVWNSGSGSIARATSVTDNEVIVWPLSAGSMYWIAVQNFGRIENTYDLTITGPAAGSPVPEPSAALLFGLGAIAVSRSASNRRSRRAS